MSKKGGDVSVVSKRRCTMADNPIWDFRLGRLTYVDLIESAIIRLDPETKTEEMYELKGEYLSFAIPCDTDPNTCIIGRNQELCNFKWNNKEVTPCAVTDDDLPTRFRTAKCDSKGRLWAGSMTLEPDPTKTINDASLYSYTKKSGLVKHIGGMKVSSGIAWSKEYKQMYVIDTLRKLLDVYDFDIETGIPSNGRKVFDFNDKHSKFKEFGAPNGITIDEGDKLWIVFSAGRVFRVDPTTRSVLKTLKFPCDKVTACCWGGPRLEVLYVTSGFYELPDDKRKKQPTSGAVYQVTNLGVKGIRPNFFSFN